jgi:Uma2 family endonuclease
MAAGFLDFGERGEPMSQIIAAPVQRTPVPSAADPTPRLWTREEYYRLGDLGFFDGQRVELIEGEIVVLSPQKAEHWTNTDRVAELLRSCFGSGYHVRMQGPIDFGPISEPEPDVAVVAGSREQYAAQHPRTAVLIVEVSESRLNYDRTRKASLYARAGIPDYWIVNLVDRQLEVRRDPRPDSSQHYGHGYASVSVFVPPAVVNPLAAPQVSLSVADLLP